MKKMTLALALSATALAATAAIAEIREQAVRDSALNLCRAEHKSGNAFKDLLPRMQAKGVSLNDAAYVLDICYAYMNGRRDQLTGE